MSQPAQIRKFKQGIFPHSLILLDFPRPKKLGGGWDVEEF
jgi:hypothetical protein